MTIAAAISELAGFLGDRLSRAERDLFGHGRPKNRAPFLPPDAVAYPETTREVARIVTACAAQGCPVIGRGMGTSPEGHSQAMRGGVCVDFSRMNRIVEVNHADMDVVVQPGLTQEILNRHLQSTGLFFPVEPGTNASLGGMAATRAGGIATVRYGSMADNVLALQAVLADGRVIRTGARARTPAAGYDLTRLLVGSEGTLGLITELTLRLCGQPEKISAAVCAFDRMRDAIDMATAAITYSIPVARLELLDSATVAAVNAYAGLSLEQKPHLLVEFHGFQQSVAEDAARFAELVDDMGGRIFRWPALAEDRAALWAIRQNAYYALLASRTGTRAVAIDLSVPLSRLRDAVEEIRAEIAASPIPGPMLGHVGVGHVQVLLLVRDQVPGEVEAASVLARHIVERALRLGGTVLGDHGLDGLSDMAAQHGPGWDVMGEIKRALDPLGILNPGKVVPLPH
ncbi:FAD-binding oxidoreductase [Tropicimonas isoalkanivorans]|uniref:D-lactate dehydrogenase (cytochrome) n=1 Tax=Tropicimonas isoalkanivorans TaxID=441112 RepID=A0A1I1G3D4_9RHOB|nr:FAD-linked oxidase C-terminal domain-containing protein [Tropicimonas isoalkanivorans]SFC06247.1 D-lactate dehydrogenase (cytochrome) [Tropicimonas isoalkanivorans]